MCKYSQTYIKIYPPPLFSLFSSLHRIGQITLHLNRSPTVSPPHHRVVVVVPHSSTRPPTMAAVEQHIIPSTSTLDPPPKPPFSQDSAASPSPPPFCTLDFSSNPILCQVTTLLRRVWLLDPPLSDQELADPKTVQDCLQRITQIVGSEDFPSSSSSSSSLQDQDGGNNSNNDDDDDKEWKKRTQFRVLSDPVVISAEKEEEEEQGKANEDGGETEGRWLKSVVSPWREEIYDVYRHVFADFWRMAVTAAAVAAQQPQAGGSIGAFEPTRGDAVSVAALPFPSSSSSSSSFASNEEREGGTMTTTFRTDTFLYPVWVNPSVRIRFSVAADGEKTSEGGQAKEEKHCWTAREGKTWTTGLWVQAGKMITLRTELLSNGDGDDGAVVDRTGLAAVFVTGHCDERKE